MIEYENSSWLLCLVFKLEGSVLPKTCIFAITNAILAATFHYVFHYASETSFTAIDQDGENIFMSQMEGAMEIWGGYTSILGFLVVFRNNQAYSRFWEGATLVNQVRGEWFNAVSALIAFCSRAPEQQSHVEDFQNLLVRLSSVLYCSALQQICELPDDALEVLDLTCIDSDSLLFLESVQDRCQVLANWIQRLIVMASASGTLVAEPPILSRCFQELAGGVVNLNNVRKIKDIPFPYPYQQMLLGMLYVHYFLTPCMAGFFMQSGVWAAVLCFFVTGGFWGVIYIALEIDQPFGDDDNDLPLVDMQKVFNASLLMLLENGSQKIPRLIDGKTTSGNGTDNDPPLEVTNRAEADFRRRPLQSTKITDIGNVGSRNSVTMGDIDLSKVLEAAEGLSDEGEGKVANENGGLKSPRSKPETGSAKSDLNGNGIHARSRADFERSLPEVPLERKLTARMKTALFHEDAGYIDGSQPFGSGDIEGARKARDSIAQENKDLHGILDKLLVDFVRIVSDQDHAHDKRRHEPAKRHRPKLSMSHGDLGALIGQNPEEPASPSARRVMRKRTMPKKGLLASHFRTAHEKASEEDELESGASGDSGFPGSDVIPADRQRRELDPEMPPRMRETSNPTLMTAEVEDFHI
eukprot:TRINITY_DN52927_c0_g1_i1.p1 TRINITY_DN52927_c0_g1~~TRINITY_DN52927_c0_g1_i1.p1  ORF type:complete len:638 (+),score=108.64 TRINITY_DN52927_c0_g1_i1:73-1986(+)